MNKGLRLLCLMIFSALGVTSIVMFRSGKWVSGALSGLATVVFAIILAMDIITARQTAAADKERGLLKSRAEAHDPNGWASER